LESISEEDHLRKYHFVGTYTEIGERRLTKFGEEILLSDEEARNAIAGGAPLVEASAFEKLGFTEQELVTYAYPGARIDAPESFIEKMRKAWALIGTQAEES